MDAEVMLEPQSTRILTNQNLNCEPEISPTQKDHKINNDVDNEASDDNSCHHCNARACRCDDQNNSSSGKNRCDFNEDFSAQSF